jgi:CO/xanthine dehydrogenase Mo-binding subunit
MPGVRHVVQVTDGVAVVADSWWQAKVARDWLEIEWAAAASGSLSSAGIARALKAAAARPGAVFRKQGETDAGMKGAAKTVEAAYELPFLAHAAMEPMNFTADVRKDSCLICGPTQCQQLAAGAAAQVTGLKPEQITAGRLLALGVASPERVRQRVVHGRAGAGRGKDPYEFRRSLLDKQPRLKRVLELAAQDAGWGQPLRRAATAASTPGRA